MSSLFHGSLGISLSPASCCSLPKLGMEAGNSVTYIKNYSIYSVLSRHTCLASVKEKAVWTTWIYVESLRFF